MCLWYTLGQHLTWSRNFGRHQYGHMLTWRQVDGVYHQLLIGCIWPLITTLMCAILIQLWSNVFVIYLGTTSDLKQELWKASIWSYAHLRASGWCIPPTTDWMYLASYYYPYVCNSYPVVVQCVCDIPWDNIWPEAGTLEGINMVICSFEGKWMVYTTNYWLDWCWINFIWKDLECGCTIPGLLAEMPIN